MRYLLVRYLLKLLLLSLVAVTPVFAGGSREADEQPRGGQPDPATAESAPQEAADSDSGDAAPIDADADATAISPELRNTLVQAGVQPLNSRIPYEDFTLPTLDESERSLASFEGNVVVINFWASWCGPCIQEMPAMQALYEDLKDSNFTIVAVNVQEQPDVVRNFIEENGYTFPVLRDASGRVAGRYGVRGLPTSYIMAPNGDLIGAKVGYHDWDTDAVRSAIARILERS